MLQLSVNSDGRKHIGDIEVVLYPIGGLVDLKVKKEGDGNFPPLGDIMLKVVNQMYEKGFDMTRANCYEISQAVEIEQPEERVPGDDRISPLTTRCCTIQFYKAVPATEENKKALEDIFSTSIII